MNLDQQIFRVRRTIGTMEHLADRLLNVLNREIASAPPESPIDPERELYLQTCYDDIIETIGGLNLELDKLLTPAEPTPVEPDPEEGGDDEPIAG